MQNHQSMAKMGRYRQIVGNKNHRKSEFRLQGSEKVQNFGLNRPIQGGDRFVANQDPRLHAKGTGQNQTLTLPTRKGSRPASKRLFWVHLDPLQPIPGPAQQFRSGELGVPLLQGHA
jgi:hypothetical protein